LKNIRKKSIHLSAQFWRYEMKVKSPEKRDGQVYARVKKANEEWLKIAAKKAGFGRVSHYLDALFDELREKELKAGKHRRKPKPRKGSSTAKKAA